MLLLSIYVLYSNVTNIYISCIMSCGNKIVSNGLKLLNIILFNTNQVDQSPMTKCNWFSTANNIRKRFIIQRMNYDKNESPRFAWAKINEWINKFHFANENIDREVSCLKKFIKLFINCFCNYTSTTQLRVALVGWVALATNGWLCGVSFC